MARHEPYGSAADIPSIADMLKELQGGKLLTRFIARDQRAKFVELEQQVRQHIEVIDRFYAVLGPRNWIVHDELPMPLLQAIGGMAADDAERQLIGYYQDPENLERLNRRLSHPELRFRSPLIERAKIEFLAGRYNTCVQLLLSVMDGFVNDVDASRRRGLHARDPDEMVAWDSVVGHHLGLAHAHASFTKTFTNMRHMGSHGYRFTSDVHDLSFNLNANGQYSTTLPNPYYDRDDEGGPGGIMDWRHEEAEVTSEYAGHPGSVNGWYTTNLYFSRWHYMGPCAYCLGWQWDTGAGTLSYDESLSEQQPIQDKWDTTGDFGARCCANIGTRSYVSQTAPAGAAKQVGNELEPARPEEPFRVNGLPESLPFRGLLTGDPGEVWLQPDLSGGLDAYATRIRSLSRTAVATQS